MASDTTDERIRYFWDRIAEARRTGERDTPLARALARWADHDIEIWRDGRWRYEGLLLYFKKWREIMAAADPSVSPDLPPHLIDPKQIAYFLGIPLEELDWPGGGREPPVDRPADPGGPPEEVGTAEAADILGVTKDTVLKLKRAGLLEYRNAAPPGSSRPVYRFTRRSVMALRTGYDRDVPAASLPVEPPRRAAGGRRRFKHLRLEE